jgi:hypothetical protein
LVFGVVVVDLLKGNVEGAGLVGGQFGGGDEEVFFQAGLVVALAFFFFGGSGDDGDVFEDGVREGVGDIVLEDDVVGEDVFDGCDDVFGFAFGKFDFGA